MSIELPRENISTQKSELVIMRPENPISPVPILLAPGFASNADSYSGFMQNMSQRGHITVCPDYEFGSRRKLGILPDINTIKQEALLSAIRQEGYLDEHGIPVVDVIAHSLGGIDIMLVARNNPENFRSIILLASNGFHPEMGVKDSLQRLQNGERADKIDKTNLTEKDAEAAALIAAGREFSKTHRRKLVTIFPEIRRASFQTIQQYIPDLRNAGVKIVIAKMEDDSWFPANEYEPYEHLVDEVISIPGYHGDIKYRPHVVAQQLSEWILSHDGNSVTTPSKVD